MYKSNKSRRSLIRILLYTAAAAILAAFAVTGGQLLNSRSPVFSATAKTERTMQLNLISASTETNDDEGWSWSESTKVLRLYGIQLSLKEYPYGQLQAAVVLPEDSTIVLVDDTKNIITNLVMENDADKPFVATIYSKGNITITGETGAGKKGNGELRVAGAVDNNATFSQFQVAVIMADPQSGGDYTSNVVINGGNINVSGASSKKNFEAHSILANDKIVVNGGKLEAMLNDNGNKLNSDLLGRRGVEINGGEVILRCMKKGITSLGDVTVGAEAFVESPAAYPFFVMNNKTINLQGTPLYPYGKNAVTTGTIQLDGTGATVLQNPDHSYIDYNDTKRFAVGPEPTAAPALKLASSKEEAIGSEDKIYIVSEPQDNVKDGTKITAWYPESLNGRLMYAVAADGVPPTEDAYNWANWSSGVKNNVNHDYHFLADSGKSINLKLSDRVDPNMNLKPEDNLYLMVSSVKYTDLRGSQFKALESFLLETEDRTLSVGSNAVRGAVGQAFDAELVFTLSNAAFAGITADMDVSAWFSNLPSFLTAKVYSSTQTSVNIRLAGTPTQTLDKTVFAAAVPGRFVNTSKAIALTENTDAYVQVVDPSVTSYDRNDNLRFLKLGNDISYTNLYGERVTKNMLNSITDSGEGWSWVVESDRYILTFFGANITYNAPASGNVSAVEFNNLTKPVHIVFAEGSRPTKITCNNGFAIRTVQNASISSISGTGNAVITASNGRVISNGSNTLTFENEGNIELRNIGNNASVINTPTISNGRLVGVWSNVVFKNSGSVTFTSDSTVSANSAPYGINGSVSFENSGDVTIGITSPQDGYAIYNETSAPVSFHNAGIVRIKGSHTVYATSGIDVAAGLIVTPADYKMTGGDLVAGDGSLITDLLVSPTLYTITFQTNGGSAVSAVEIPATNSGLGKKFPSAPTKDNYTFVGFYTQNGSGGNWGSQVLSTTPITESTELYAKWRANSYTVDFDTDGGAGEFPSISAEYGGSVTLPSPTKTGHTFGGWFTQPNGMGTELDADLVPSLGDDGEEVTVYAKWTVETYTIRFDVNGGSSSAPENISCSYGQTITIPANPTHSTLYFMGWFRDLSDPTTRIAATVGDLGNSGATVTYKAKWAAGFPVTFEMNGHGAAPSVDPVSPGGKLTKPADPAADGYNFVGWFTDSTLTTQFDFVNTEIDSAKTIYAKWNAIVPEFSGTSTALPGAIFDTAYSNNGSLFAVKPIAGVTFVFSATGLPGGIAIDSATGALTGTPTSAFPDRKTFTVRVTASNGAFAEKQFTIAVAKKQIAVEWGENSFVYNGQAQAPSASVNVGGVKYVLSVTGAVTNVSQSGAAVTADWKSDQSQLADNYELTGASSTVVIRKATISGISGDSVSKEYDGLPAAISLKGLLTGDQVSYSLAKNGKFTSVQPNLTNKGAYAVWYKVSRNDNFFDYVSSVSVTIEGEREVTFTVSGKVVDKSGVPVDGAVLVVKAGNSVYDIVVTDEEGSYSIFNLPARIYNLTVVTEDSTVTLTIDLTSDQTALEIKLGAPRLNTGFDVKSSGSAPEYVVDGLENLFSQEDKTAAANPNQSVSVDMTVESLGKNDLTESMTQALKNKYFGLAFSVSASRIMTVSGVTGEAGKLTQSHGLLTMRIPLPTELRGKTDNLFFVDTGLSRSANGTVKTISSTPDSVTGEYFEISVDGLSIILHFESIAQFAFGYGSIGGGGNIGGGDPEIGTVQVTDWLLPVLTVLYLAAAAAFLLINKVRGIRYFDLIAWGVYTLALVVCAFFVWNSVVSIVLWFVGAAVSAISAVFRNLLKTKIQPLAQKQTPSDKQ